MNCCFIAKCFRFPAPAICVLRNTHRSKGPTWGLGAGSGLLRRTALQTGDGGLLGVRDCKNIPCPHTVRLNLENLNTVDVGHPVLPYLLEHTVTLGKTAQICIHSNTRIYPFMHSLNKWRVSTSYMEVQDYKDICPRRKKEPEGSYTSLVTETQKPHDITSQDALYKRTHIEAEGRGLQLPT